MINMRRVRRSVVLICGTIFIIIQWKLFLEFSAPTKDENALQRNSPSPSSLYNNIKAFIEVCQKHNIPVVLADVNILTKVHGLATSNSTGHVNNNCLFLCDVHKVTTFFVTDRFFQHEEEFVSGLNSIGFSVQFFTSKHTHIRTKAPGHYLMNNLGHVIHLVRLFEVPTSQHKSYFWTSPLGDPAEQGAADGKILEQVKFTALDDLMIGKYPAAFDQFDVIKVSMDGINFRAPQNVESFLHQLRYSRFIECNKTRSESFHAQFGRDTSNDAEMFRNNAQELLSIAKKSLDQINTRFWISSGTCLGWFRQCDIIPYSKDVDIGMWITDYKENVIPTMQANGLFLKRLFGQVSDSFELTFQFDDVRLDIFFFYEEGDTMWNGGTQARTGKKFKFIFPKFELCHAELLGLLIQVPCDTEEYIKANYGDQWFVPVTKWDWKGSPPNVRENGQWPEEQRAELIQIFS